MINNYEFIFREKEDDLAGFPASRHIRYCADIHADEPWSVPLKEFVSFLGSIYGYDIREKIIIKSLLPDCSAKRVCIFSRIYLWLRHS